MLLKSGASQVQRRTTVLAGILSGGRQHQRHCKAETPRLWIGLVRNVAGKAAQLWPVSVAARGCGVVEPASGKAASNSSGCVGETTNVKRVEQHN
ncbi:hypothetical protein NL676_039543 [Syzygium grande]|nr:hypothetical protein NL676_039543 [Syzygium grande]